ncbi:UNVERIFIED_CONTAM: hypothetical protein FKN15_023723 [Acipenser sinensis]
MEYTAVLVLPILVVIAAGEYYLYTEITRLMSKSAVWNKVVVITDAVSGMGKECSRVFHTGGARVILCGKSWEKLEALYDTLSSAADPSVTFTPKLVVLDFSDIDAIPDVTREILECYGCVDVLISNASMKVKAPVQNVSLEMDKRIMDTNYFGPITLTKGLLPSMISRRSGQLVLVNSIQGRLGVPFRTAYAASKHAAQAFFDCLRAEVEEFGISVSTVSPTFIRSYHQQPEPHNAEKCIWKYTSEQAVLYYEYTGNKKVNLLSTVVPTEFRGKGVGKRLAEAAMDFVVEENLKADLSCWYIKQYVEENPLPNYKDHISD